MRNSSLSLDSSAFHVDFDSERASIQVLQNPSDEYGTNFVLGAEQAPELDIEDSRFWGHLIFHVSGNTLHPKGCTMTSGLSRDIRTISGTEDDRIVVTYQGNSGHEGGFKGFSVTAIYTLTGPSRDILDWSIEITNQTSEPVEFEDIGIPLMSNSYWGNDQTFNYEKVVHRHSFVAKNGSYIYWQRPNGDGPMLVMMPHRNTSLEFKHRYREAETIFGEQLPKWEGLAEFYIHSKHIATARAEKACQYLPATSLTLAPGESHTYGFCFRWAADYIGLRNAIYASGGLDVVSMPGLVIPANSKVTLALRCEDTIETVTGEAGKKAQITASGTSGEYHLYKLGFTTLGCNYVTVTFGNLRSAVLQFYSIEPIEVLIKKHSAFLAQHQLAKTTTRGYNGAFLQWDMTTRKLITWDDYPGGGWKEWMAGGSDDLGLAPAAFLSEKCFYFPVQSEISAIDYHIKNFLFGYLIGARGSDDKLAFQVYRWYDGQDGTPKDTGIWRAYNYTHIANTFFNMYKIGKAYPWIETRYKPLEYLTFAYEILQSMYCKISLPNPIGDAANELGLMGESTVPEIIEALKVEGMNYQQQKLRAFIDRKLHHYKRVKYPFASEMTIDTTGFESVYALGKVGFDVQLIEKCQKASLACRGLQPLWYFYGSDNRMMGESYWNLGYETQLGSWQQQDYLVNYSSSNRGDFAEAMRSTYGAFLAGWANINSGQIDAHPSNIGAASWLWQSEGGEPSWSFIPLVGNWWAWSGEADLGFWGGLRTASVNVVQDPIVGLYAYGGKVELINDKYLIEPMDGVQCRLTMFNLNNMTIHVPRTRFTHVTMDRDGSNFDLDLQNIGTSTCSPSVTLINFPAASYEVSITDITKGKLITTSTGSSTTFELWELSTAFTKVSFRRR
ncbi:uncharacterized protein BHQ10_009467 [Talaromyces amestolkiae]|uniref:Uncharacterized protein n=1 Tax=Talaromyces amestolkiae TaxID=1196081 RepID=A0A364LCA0_TALAM|nr:uncharacterized protein BHQ10_009467 [Talaromyces amestolkiae]RAO73455.1 hypothetical protein BHQ10_009467 [Talaromyces amestolkiae]